MKVIRTARAVAPGTRAAWRMAVGLACLLAIGEAAAETLPRKTLEDCVAMALDQHPDLKAAAAQVDAADQRVRQAVAGYLPQVTANYETERRRGSVGSSTGTSFGESQSRTFTFYSTGVGFSQLLFDFGQTLAAIRSAQASRRAADADRETRRQAIIFDVKQAYFDTLAAARLLGVAEETLRQTQQQVAEAQSRFDVGLAPKIDVTRAQVQEAGSERDLLVARNNVALARETLRNAMGLEEPLTFDLVDAAEVVHHPVDEAGAVEAAYANRPELQRLLAQQAATEQEVARLQRDHLPNVTGNGGYNWAGSDFPLESNWSVGASLNLSVFSGGLTAAQVREAQATLAALRFDAEAVRQDVARDVRQAALNLEQAVATIAVTVKGQQQARENLALAEGRYRTGIGNIIELTDARALFTTAEAEHVRAVYTYHQSLAALEHAIGGPLPGPKHGGNG